MYSSKVSYSFFRFYSFFRDQADARRMKTKEARLRREQRIAQKKKEMLQAYRDEDKAKK